MSWPTRAALFVFGGVVVITAILLLVVGANRSGGSRAAAGRGGPASPAPGVTRLRSAASRVARREPPGLARSGPPAPVQENPEALDPVLRRAHERLLRDRPVFQRLPYRDAEIGVAFDRVAADGRLELLVTYLGARSRAIRDFQRLLTRYGDSGAAYVERYTRVF